MSENFNDLAQMIELNYLVNLFYRLISKGLRMVVGAGLSLGIF